jgi:hypothetical protein
MDRCFGLHPQFRNTHFSPLPVARRALRVHDHSRSWHPRNSAFIRCMALGRTTPPSVRFLADEGGQCRDALQSTRHE